MRPFFRLRSFAPSRSIGPWRRGLLTRAVTAGPSEPPLIESTIGEYFSKIVPEHGDRNAVVSIHQNERLTYYDLDQQSNRLARGIESIGVKKGDRVAVSLGNNVEHAVLTYALFKIGAILVPLNPGFNTNQVISALTHLGVSHLFISTETNLPRRPSRDNTPLLSQIITDTQSSVLQSEAIPSLQKVILIDNSAGRVNTSNLKATTPYTTLSKSSIFDTATLSPQNLSNEDIINIQFTSGTTSTPKAATLTHRSILNNGFQIGDRMLLTPQDIICCPPPLFHCFGCILGYMASVTHASSIIFPSESFNAAATLTTIQNEKCTALYGVPTMFIEELELIQSLQIPTSNFKTLRTGIAAGSSIPATLMKKLHQTLNLTELTICYGMTETSPVSAMTTTDDPIERRIDSVGRCMPHVKAKIVHPGDPEKVLGVGEKGELVVGGYLVMKGYWGDEKKTEEVLKRDEDGEVWMHTGDEATLSAEGYISITGRIKDLIIRGGENIHPLEIENCLLSHKDVLDVAVVGIPDEKYGEVVGAFVVLRKENEGEEVKDEEMREFVRGVLSDHLVPKYIFRLKTADELPKTPSGKIQKFKLREMAMQMLKERTK